MRIISAIVIAFVAVMSTASAAESWKIMRVTGEAWLLTQKSERTPLASGTEFPKGASILTGNRARVLMQKSAQTMVIGPNTRMSLRTSPGRGLETTVQQQSGTIQYEVEKRDVRYFSVETPLLAAVVKGTRFTVNANQTRSEVAVSRGKVEVTDFATGKVGNVLPGQKATSSSSGFNVTGSGRVQPITQGAVGAPQTGSSDGDTPIIIRKPLITTVDPNTDDGADSDDDGDDDDNGNNGNHGNGNNGNGNNGNNGNHGNGNNGNAYGVGNGNAYGTGNGLGGGNGNSQGNNGD